MVTETIQGIIIGVLSMILIDLILFIFYKIFFHKKKHTLTSIRDKLIDLNKAAEIVTKNSSELNKIMEDLEYA